MGPASFEGYNSALQHGRVQLCDGMLAGQNRGSKGAHFIVFRGEGWLESELRLCRRVRTLTESKEVAHQTNFGEFFRSRSCGACRISVRRLLMRIQPTDSALRQKNMSRLYITILEPLHLPCAPNSFPPPPWLTLTDTPTPHHPLRISDRTTALSTRG